MRHTLMKMLAVVAAAPLMVAAQNPPPRQPTPKPSERPSPAPVPSPKRLIDPELRSEIEHRFELMGPQLEELRKHADEMRWQAKEFAQLDHERMRFDTELLREQIGRIDVERIKADAKAFAKIDVERLKFDAEQMKGFTKFDAEHIKFAAEDAARAMIDFSPKFELYAPGATDRFLDRRPRAPWASDDPADSLYRVAREALNRGEYRRAAQVFNEVTKKYPKSQYAQDCAYWEAFSRYRVGTDSELRTALKILEGIDVEQMMRVGRETAVDIPSLRARIQGALAARGDPQAAKDLEREAAQSRGCDREEISVRAEALSALAQMDIAAAMPAVKKVLQRRDECTVELRRRALYVLGRHPSGDAVPLMLDAAKNDPDANIRGEAMSLIGRVAGDQAVPLLEDLLRNSTEERTQRSAISALGSIDTERARRAVRTIIERNDAPERVRYEAIMSLSRERDHRVVSAEDQNYLRSLYGKLDAPRLKEAVLTAVSRIPTAENEQFLLAVARNVNEVPSLRNSALQRLGRMESVGVADIAKLYDVADARSLREHILSALYQRKEPEAVDKMMEIARRDTDPQIRRYAISLLMRRNDPRATKLLQELLDK